MAGSEAPPFALNLSEEKRRIRGNARLTLTLEWQPNAGPKARSTRTN